MDNGARRRSGERGNRGVQWRAVLHGIRCGTRRLYAAVKLLLVWVQGQDDKIRDGKAPTNL
jgi:hypothetical protein